MIEYPKIETPFKRDMEGSKKLIEGSFRDETVEYLKDAEWVFTEKVDGTNISVEWDGHAVHYHGRTERANIPSTIVNFLTKQFGEDVNEELFEQTFGEKWVILYGEGYGPKIQNGGLYRPEVSFILFDVYMPGSGIWLKRDAMEGVAKAFGVDVVPVIMRGTIQEAVDFVKCRPDSTMGTAKMEGLVGKPAVDILDRMGNRVITKIKVKDFV